MGPVEATDTEVNDADGDRRPVVTWQLDGIDPVFEQPRGERGQLLHRPH
jgi:hypothetical protein